MRGFSTSTAVALRLLAASEELEAPQGKLSLGILLFQDFLIVPMILLVPVGAVLVAGGEVVACGFNQPIHEVDPTAHAEVVTLRRAAH